MKSLVISIHDVSPETRDQVTRILAGLAGAGVGRVSLLVVPDHHHRANITSDPAFGSWLRDLVAAGHEAVLHGYFHQRERHAHESTRTRFFTRIYTADEGEFFDITYAGACELLARGRDELAGVAGVQPEGFIAPAWLLSPEGESAARDLGFAYTTRLKSVSALASGTVHFSQSLCWSVRSSLRRVISLGWNHFLFQRVGPNPLIRISIHPPDIDHRAIWHQILTFAQSAAADREPMGYRDFVSGLL